MTPQQNDHKLVTRPPSTAQTRRDWALDYAMRCAAEGRFATVRQLQAATREQFGRGIGNREATAVAAKALRLGGGAAATDGHTAPSQAAAAMPHGEALKIIARLMREQNLRVVELLDHTDSNFRLKFNSHDD